MSGEVRADPVELARAAQSYLDTSVAAAGDLRSVRADSVLSAADIGNVTHAAALDDAYATVAESAGSAIEQLIAVLEVDNESLLRVAFAYQQADEEAARKLRQKYPNQPI